jgi:hypothetical protein
MTGLVMEVVASDMEAGSGGKGAVEVFALSGCGGGWRLLGVCVRVAGRAFRSV